MCDLRNKYKIVQSLSLNADRHTAVQAMPSLSRNRKFCHHIQNSQPLDPNLGHLNLFISLTFCLHETNCDVTFISTLGLLSRVFSSNFVTKCTIFFICSLLKNGNSNCVALPE
jgi:hypothetical protein